MGCPVTHPLQVDDKEDVERELCGELHQVDGDEQLRQALDLQ